MASFFFCQKEYLINILIVLKRHNTLFLSGEERVQLFFFFIFIMVILVIKGVLN